MSKANNTDETAEESAENSADESEEYELPIPGLMAWDKDEDGKGVVMYLRGLTAEEEHVAATGKSIAEHNPEHPPDAPTVGMVYKEALDERWGDAWQEWPASYLTFRAGNEGMRAYSFPVTRLAWGHEYAEIVAEGDEDLTPEEVNPERGTGPDVACGECPFTAMEGETKADYALHFGECPECGGELETVPEDHEDEEDEDGHLITRTEEGDNGE